MIEIQALKSQVIRNAREVDTLTHESEADKESLDNDLHNMLSASQTHQRVALP